MVIFGKLDQTELDIIRSKKDIFLKRSVKAGLYSKKTSRLDEDIRKSSIYFLDINEFPVIYNVLQSTIIQHFSKYNFDLSLPASIQYTWYGEGGHFKWHQDVINDNRDTKRFLTMSVNISDQEEYDGGELILKHDYKQHQLGKDPGSFVIFPAFLLHKANKVTRGERESMVVWIHQTNDNLKKLKIKYNEIYGVN